MLKINKYLIFGLCLWGTMAQGQRGRYRQAPALGIIKITASSGLSYYLGDLRDAINFKHLNVQGGLGITYRLTERLVARGEVRYYGLSGSQAGTRNWYNNLSFRARNPDGYVGLQAELFKYSNQPRINPYLFGGVGMTYITPKAQYQGQWYSLAPLQTEGVKYGRLPRVFLAGIGATWRINEFWGVGVELSDNFANSDYLDDVSSFFTDMAGKSELAIALADRRGELTPPLPLNDPGSIRGNPKVKDAYGFLSIRVERLLSTRAQRAEKRTTKCYY